MHCAPGGAANTPDPESPPRLEEQYEAFHAHLSAGCKSHRGCLQSLVGDRAVVTFNAVVTNTTHRPSATNFVLQLLTDWRAVPASSGVRLRAAAVTRQGQCAVWGRLNVLVGDAVDTCSAMLGLGDEMQVLASGPKALLPTEHSTGGGWGVQGGFLWGHFPVGFFSFCPLVFSMKKHVPQKLSSGSFPPIPNPLDPPTAPSRAVRNHPRPAARASVPFRLTPCGPSLNNCRGGPLKCLSLGLTVLSRNLGTGNLMCLS